FGPQRAAAGDAGLGTGKVNPTRFQVHGGQGETATIAIPEATIDCEQDHCSEGLSGSVEKMANLLGRKQFPALLGTIQAEDFLARPLEPRPEPHWLVDQPGVESMLEQTANPLDDVAESGWTPLTGHPVPETGKVLGPQIGHESGLAEVAYDPVASFLVV